MKMLTGLMPASEGRAWLFGKEIDPHDVDTRRRVGYMSQAFSLYADLSVRDNVMLSRDEKGIVTMGLKQFLLDPNSLDL